MCSCFCLNDALHEFMISWFTVMVYFQEPRRTEEAETGRSMKEIKRKIDPLFVKRTLLGTCACSLSSAANACSCARLVATSLFNDLKSLTASWPLLQ